VGQSRLKERPQPGRALLFAALSWVACVCLEAHAQNYSDIWWNPEESGWGITVADHETQLFAVWYTYRDDGSPTWFVIPGGTFSQGRRLFSGDLYATTGPPYDRPFDASRVTASKVGSASFDFAPVGLVQRVALFTYTVGNVTQTKQIRRQSFGNAAPYWGVDATDIWWNAQESGWGLTLAQHGNNIFGVWFTYDAQGRPLFLVMPGVTFDGANRFTGTLYTTTGPYFGNASFDPAAVRASAVGTATLSLDPRSGGTFTALTNGLTQARTIARQPFGNAAPVKMDAAVLTQWEQQMTDKGRQNCEQIKRNAADPAVDLDHKIIDIYYDGAKVYSQIGDYAGARDPASAPYWRGCAVAANHVYRDLYALTSACYGGGFGCVAGYWNFTTGMRLDYEKNGDVLSRQTAILVSQHASFASDAEPVEATVTAERSREVAYAIRGYIDAEVLGETRRAKLAAMVNNALGHIDQWFISRSYRCPQDCDPQAAVGQYYIQPFMVGLTAEALIRYHGRTGDARVVPALRVALDWIWDNAWLPGDEAFWYDNWVADPSLPFPPATSHGADRGAAPSLNLLIAPAFAWMYSQTGETKYRDRGDRIFAGGVRNAYLDGGKQFDQNYFWSFDYLDWRR